EEPLTDVPVLVALTPDRIRYEADTTGTSLRIVTADDMELPHDIETWQPEGTSIVWVKLPALQVGAQLFIYYGNAEATSATQPASVWEDYVFASHLSSTLEDASGHAQLDAQG